jgi:hypothetical protein
MVEALSRGTLRKLENADAFPLIALQAIREVRADVDGIEAKAIMRARELGASLEDIADAMGITRQGVAYRIKQLTTRPPTTGRVVDIAAEEAEEPDTPGVP